MRRCAEAPSSLADHLRVWYSGIGVVYFSLKEFNLGIMDMLRVLFNPFQEAGEAATAEPRKLEGKMPNAKLEGRGKKKKPRRER